MTYGVSPDWHENLIDAFMLSLYCILCMSFVFLLSKRKNKERKDRNILSLAAICCAGAFVFRMNWIQLVAFPLWFLSLIGLCSGIELTHQCIRDKIIGILVAAFSLHGMYLSVEYLILGYL